ncbi:cytochrome P450 [Verrucomicrobiales bacterium]|jgi:cytochrome P450|nr:cytochrome P450 [Verrucomicrobiales bacterium]
MKCPHDPFQEQRKAAPIQTCDFQGETVPMILRHADLRAACKDWKTFSSDAPFRVPIPSEEELRRVRQLPIEADPPEQTEWRKIVEPFFKRARAPEVIESVEKLFEEMLDLAFESKSIEIVRDFALPVQSRALTYLLDVPESEGEVWTSWGIHVFKDGEDGEQKGMVLENYLQEKFDAAEKNPGDDFFSALTKVTFQDRPLTRDEMTGFANLAFAGGRDTVIHTIASIFSYFAEHPEALKCLKGEPKRIVAASEEFFRVVTPLTHIGRVCPVTTDVHGHEVKPKGRVSMCWSSANNDETVFDSPEEIRLDRKPNPHVAFGFGAHLCLGAPHARLLVRTLIEKLSERVSSIEIIECEEKIETEQSYERSVGYESLVIAMNQH